MRQNFFVIIAIVGISFFLNGCTTTQEQNFKAPNIQRELSKYQIRNNDKTTNKITKTTKIKKKKKVKIKIEYVPMVESENISIGKTNISEHYLFKGNSFLKISVENMPLNQFVKLVFGKLLKTNFIVGKKVERDKSKITLNVTTPLPKNEFFETIKTLLSQYGVSIDIKNNLIYFISKTNPNKNNASMFFIGRDLPHKISTDKSIVVIFPVYYINPSQYIVTIKRLISHSPFIMSDSKKKVYIIEGKYSTVKKVLQVIKIFDTPYFTKKHAFLMKLYYISPDDFVNTLKKVLPMEGVPLSSSIHSSGLILEPLDGLSSVLVISPKIEWIQVVKFWKSKLDSLKALGNQPRLFVYYPKNRKASELSKIFSQFSKEILAKKKKGRLSNFTPKAKVVVDKERNALVVYATPSEYRQIERVLKELDTLPKQVFAQVTILEVTLTGKLEYGLEWYLRHSGKVDSSFFTMGGLGLNSTGFNASIITDTAKFQALINAFAQKDLINVLSSPSLVVMDNKEASIDVGTQVPTVESESTNSNIQDNGTTALVRTIKYRNTGVILHIKPTINSNGVVTMTISQEVSDAQTNNTSKIDSPLILTRSIKTTVALKSGATLLLGGLIKNTKSATINKVPLVGDIPVLGNLFKTTSKSSEKTELIVEITPYILPDTGSAERMTKAYKVLMDLLKNP